MLNRQLLSLLGATLAMGFVACSASDARRGIAPTPEHQAPHNINESFSVAKPDSTLTTDANALIGIKKAALDKEYLLQAGVISQPIVALGNSLKSRVVTFKRARDRVFMLEATQGHSISGDIPQHLILASFPIVSESDDVLTIDFNAGMQSVFVASDWKAQDLEGGEYKPDFQAQKVDQSYIEEARLTDKGVLLIRQVAQLSTEVLTPTPNGSFDKQTVEVRYYLSPYEPDPSFEPVVSRDFDRLGFFEVAPFQDINTPSVVRATKWNLKKGVTYAISANTPVEYKQVIREAIQYYNKILGADVIKVVEAPAGVNAPNPDYNLVQWVTWDDAGFAYADAQMDPRSGQILHAQIYLTSAFAVSGRQQARFLLQRIRDQQSKRQRLVAIRGMETLPLCDFEPQEAFARDLEKLLASKADDATFLRMSQDYVREVTAHEVGHTLGLRHNFAGSESSNLSLDKRDELFKTYISGQEIPADATPSSTMMDYQLLQDAIITGHNMLRQEKALDYDTKALSALYKGEHFKPEELPLFCTDSHLKKFLDCRQFDAGSSSIAYAEWATRRAFENLPYQLVESFISKQAPARGYEPLLPEQIPLDPAALADRILSERFQVVAAFSNKVRLLKIERQFPSVSPYNEEEVRAALVSYVEKEVAQVGGLSKLLPQVPEDYADTVVKKFEQLVNSPQYVRGVGLNDQPYEFTEEVRNKMIEIVKNLMPKVQKLLVQEDVGALAGNYSLTEQKAFTEAGTPKTSKSLQWEDDQLGYDYATLAGARAEHYVLATTAGSEIEADIQIPATETEAARQAHVKLPTFSYDTETRVAAVGLLAATHGEAPDWGLFERAEIKKKLTKLMTDSIGVSVDKLELASLPRAVARWVLENNQVLAALQ